jgi:hypothetical protein
MLYERGQPVSRDQLADMADALFDQSEIRSGPKAHRRYTTRHVDLLHAAFRLNHELGIEPDRLATLLRDPAEADEIRTHLSRCLDDLEALRRFAVDEVSA